MMLIICIDCFVFTCYALFLAFRVTVRQMCCLKYTLSVSLSAFSLDELQITLFQKKRNSLRQQSYSGPRAGYTLQADDCRHPSPQISGSNQLLQTPVYRLEKARRSGA